MLPRRHSFSSLYRLSSADVDADASNDQQLANFSDIGNSEEASTRDLAPRRPISRSNSLSNLSSKAAAVASLGLIAGAEAFTSGAATATATASASTSDHHAGAGNTLTRSNSARSLTSVASNNSLASAASASSLTSLNVVDPSTLMDVGSHMSAILDGSSNGSGLDVDVPSALRTSTNLLSKISNTEMISSALVGAANRVFDNDQKKVEAEVFGDLSLVSGLVQLANTAGHKNKMAFEATGIVSRCFGLLSDYIPDGVVSPEEAVFQSCMLAISAASLTKSLQPVVSTKGGLNGQTVTYHEKKAYSVFRKHAAMPWLQYRKMLAEAADWIDLDPYEGVEDKVSDHDDGNFLYLVARGDAFDLDVESSSLGLMGTLNLADKIKHAGNNNKTNANSNTDPASSSSDQAEDANAGRRPAQVCAPRAGASGAKLLRISTPKLLNLMKADEIMAESVKSIVLADMQEKLMGFVSSQNADENPQLPGEVAFVQ